MKSIGANRSLTARVVCVIIVCLPLAAQDDSHYRRSDLHRLMREASSVDQYRTLAAWFHAQETGFRRKAEARDRELEWYKNVPFPAKFPSRADTARGLRDYYAGRANQMAQLASRYDQEVSRLDAGRRPPASAPSLAGSPATPPSPALSKNEKMLLDKIEQLERLVGRPPDR